MRISPNRIILKLVDTFRVLALLSYCWAPTEKAASTIFFVFGMTQPQPLGSHYENTPIQVYWKFYNLKKENFQINNSDIFYTSTHNLCFWAEIIKIMYTPVNPSFTI